MLIDCCFIPDGKNEGNAEDRLEEGHPGGDPLKKTTTNTGRVGQVGRTVDGSGDGCEITGIFTHETTSQDGSRARTGTNSIWGRWAISDPLLVVRPPQRVSKGWA